jgi:hypothetical protein
MGCCHQIGNPALQFGVYLHRNIRDYRSASHWVALVEVLYEIIGGELPDRSVGLAQSDGIFSLRTLDYMTPHLL